MSSQMGVEPSSWSRRFVLRRFLARSTSKSDTLLHSLILEHNNTHSLYWYIYTDYINIELILVEKQNSYNWSILSPYKQVQPVVYSREDRCYELFNSSSAKFKKNIINIHTESKTENTHTYMFVCVCSRLAIHNNLPIQKHKTQNMQN